MHDVVSFLEGVSPNSRKGSSFGGVGAAGAKKVGAGSKLQRVKGRCPLNTAGVCLPMVNGRSLGIAYLGKI